MNDEQTPATFEEIPAAAITDVSMAWDALFGTRLGNRKRKAIISMAIEGLSLPLAAKKHGIRPDNLNAAFSKPHIKKAYNQIVKDIRENAAGRAWLRVNYLGESAQSEQVRLKANQWVAGVDGISPIQKVQGHISHSHSFSGFEYGDDDPIEGQAHDTKSDGDAAQQPDNID